MKRAWFGLLIGLLFSPSAMARTVTLTVEEPQTPPSDLTLKIPIQSQEFLDIAPEFRALLAPAEMAISFPPFTPGAWSRVAPRLREERLSIPYITSSQSHRGLSPILWIRALSTKNANWVPLSALENQTGSSARVYVVVDNKLEAREVSVWPQLFGNRILVSRFSRGSEKLVVEGVSKIRRANTFRFVSQERLP